MEHAVGAEVVIERLREHERVGDQRAARVVADEQHWSTCGDVVHPAHLGSEVDVGHRTQRRERPPDVLGGAQVEGIGGRARASQATRIDRAGDVRRGGTKHPGHTARRTGYSADKARD